MKNTLLFLLASIILISCNSNPESYTLTGTLTGKIADGTNVFLRKNSENGRTIDVDTAKVETGKFVFIGNSNALEIHYVFVDKLNGYTAVVIENGEIEMSAQKDSLGFAKIEGTEQNEFLDDYREKSQAAQERASNIQNDMQNAGASRDTVLVNALREEYDDLLEEYQDFEKDYIKTHSNALISAILIDRALVTKTSSIEEVQELYNGLSSEIKETRAGEKIMKALEAQKEREEKAKNTEVGAKAPNFSGPSPSGDTVALNDVLGKATLIDFWAAWCRPCRAENPNIVNVYEKYHDKGLNIIGVSLDKTADAWKKAIADDDLTWHHISNIAYFNDAIAKLYNVNAIPAAFLLDENGVIVAKNLRGPALEAKVAELLN
ncbi:MAG: AhpC/TSA family protein [Maribacter sp.]|nr:AhpC/TSA family protein [Maribacter sp.]